MYVLLWITWLAVLTWLVPWALRALELECANFRGNTIPTAFGLYLLLASAPAVAYLTGRYPGIDSHMAFLVVITGFGLLGFLDDLYGDRTDSGLKGHVVAAIQGRLTTGFLKAAGGIVLACIVSAVVLGHGWPRWPLDTIVIALSANAINLLDLRPGRASAVILIVIVPIMVVGANLAVSSVLLTLLVPLLYTYALDSRGKAMLGDTGSNLLGGALGLAVILTVNAYVEMAVLLCLIALHLFAERRSITRTIEETPLLRRFDSWTGIR